MHESQLSNCVLDVENGLSRLTDLGGVFRDGDWAVGRGSANVNIDKFIISLYFY